MAKTATSIYIVTLRPERSCCLEARSGEIFEIQSLGKLVAGQVSALLSADRMSQVTDARNFSHSSLPHDELTASSFKPSKRTVGYEFSCV